MLAHFLIESGLAEPQVTAILACFKPHDLAKGEFLVKSGQVSQSLAFLESGLLQFYSLSPEGEERTSYISLPQTFVTSLLSFLNETPANESIRALTDSRLLEISKSELQILRDEIPAFKDLYIKLLEWQICCIDKNRFDLITLTSEQRYEKLLREEPEILQQVPLQYIASMLGMTPRHLSRLRAKI